VRRRLVGLKLSTSRSQSIPTFYPISGNMDAAEAGRRRKTVGCSRDSHVKQPTAASIRSEYRVCAMQTPKLAQGVRAWPSRPSSLNLARAGSPDRGDTTGRVRSRDPGIGLNRRT